MPSRRNSRSRSRSRSQSPTNDRPLPHNADTISESDYFLKNVEFRVWLKDEKGKYLDELTGEKARSYFRRFVKAWNKGKLPRSLYAGVEPAAQSSTAYKWSFKTTKADRDALTSAREDVESGTYGSRSSAHASSARSSSSRHTGPIGPALPSASDLTLARESAAELAAAERSHKRKRDRAEALDRVEDMLGPRSVGREAQMEKKRAKREEDRAFRARGEDAGLEADEGTLMGGGDSFRDAIAKRDAARRRFEEKKQSGRMDRVAETQERTSAIREKDKATMEMFQRMAAERFG